MFYEQHPGLFDATSITPFLRWNNQTLPRVPQGGEGGGIPDGEPLGQAKQHRQEEDRMSCDSAGFTSQARNWRGKASQGKKSRECFQKKVATDTIRKDKQYRKVFSNTALFSDLKVRDRRHSGEVGTAVSSIPRSRQGSSYESGLPTELSSLGDVRRLLTLAVTVLTDKILRAICVVLIISRMRWHLYSKNTAMVVFCKAKGCNHLQLRPPGRIQQPRNPGKKESEIVFS